jgi:hypothetical protein
MEDGRKKVRAERIEMDNHLPQDSELELDSVQSSFRRH